MIKTPLIYNLFPRLVGDLRRWPQHATRAVEMGFDWLFINPFHYPGFSGSLYAVKDYYRLNPLFYPADDDASMEALRSVIDEIHDLGLAVMMDLVVNHTSKDSPLIKAHPTWFRRDKDGYVISPSAIDPADARKVTVWGDLAEVDNAKSSDRAALWAYWTALVQYYLELGIDGFRCDAAYKVPPRLWEQLISAGRRQNPRVLFAAETLGCRLPEVRALADCGFDYLHNSSKWWNFDERWCIAQHTEFGEIAPSIAFPESHDTPRMMSESGGRVQVQRQRYAFAAAFSEGLLMPIGYEFGFTRKLDVVTMQPDDWEETGHDLCGFIATVNRIKREQPALRVEGRWSVVSDLDSPTTVLCKRSGEPADPPVLVAINKDWDQPQRAPLPTLGPYFGQTPARMIRINSASPTAEALPNGPLALEPAEIVFIVAA